MHLSQLILQKMQKTNICPFIPVNPVHESPADGPQCHQLEQIVLRDGDIRYLPPPS